MADRKKLILVTDDDELLREQISATLQRCGFETIEATNGENALKVFAERTPDALVTDHVMPKMTGEQLIVAVKKLRADLPVLLVTGEASQTVLLNLMQYSRFLALYKPFRTQMLFKALTQVMSQPYLGEYGRRFFRLNTNLEVNSKDFQGAIVANVSLGGLFIRTEVKLPLGSQIHFSIPALRTEIDAEIAWIREEGNAQNLPAGYGVRFVDLPKEKAQAIQSFIMREMSRKRIGWFTDPEDEAHS